MLMGGAGLLLLVGLVVAVSRPKAPGPAENRSQQQAVQEVAKALPYSIVGAWTGTHTDQRGKQHVIQLTVGEDLTVESTRIHRNVGGKTETFTWAVPDTVTFSDDQIEATRTGEGFSLKVDQPRGVGRYSLDASELFLPMMAANPLAARPAFEVAPDDQGLVANLRQVLVPNGGFVCPPESVLDFRPARFTIQDFCGMKSIYQGLPVGYVVEAPLIACEKIPLSQSLMLLLTVRNPGIQIKIAAVDKDADAWPQRLQSAAMVSMEARETSRTIEVRFYKDGRKRAEMPQQKVEWDLVPL
ncbi:MAG: hypothetical protein HY901_37895 [Deltaproteobacteria bacterium]|nr:hypothetical protein [Deltaproteobacteria bacterium]